ncbi:hypothetical protein GLOIN_2v1882275 [Rhizophagus irregularis DAOM 181602=DAOM 197198]|nr:hypothetical protein GLOIN_2v1882275 [Rhizophagus irregularis DAOM 181602=DAOM 197198]
MYSSGFCGKTGKIYFAKSKSIGRQRQSGIGGRKLLNDLYIVCPVLIELPYYSYELREEIWPDGIDKNEIKVDDNADEIKRCNDVIKLCKNHLRELFHKGLSSEKMLIQAEKENAPDFITAFSDCLRQVSNVQISTQSGFSNNNFISAFLNLELTRPSMAGWYTTNLTSPERYVC